METTPETSDSESPEQQSIASKFIQSLKPSEKMDKYVEKFCLVLVAMVGFSVGKYIYEYILQDWMYRRSHFDWPLAHCFSLFVKWQFQARFPIAVFSNEWRNV